MRAVLSIAAIEKALQHKYIRKVRIGTTKAGAAKYKYIYAEKKGDSHRHGEHTVAGNKLQATDAQIHEGASFSAGSGKGHYVIDKVEGSMVHFHMDDADGKGTPGQPMREDIDRFKQRVYDAHKDAAKKHAEEGLAKRLDVLKRARAVNPEGKHAQRARAEVNRWQDMHKERLPKPSGLSEEEQQQREEAARKSAEAKPSPPKPATEKRILAPGDLPKIAEGSSKQVRWATDIRHAHAENMQKLLHNAEAFNEGKSSEDSKEQAIRNKAVEEGHQLITAMLNDKSARLWIDTRAISEQATRTIKKASHAASQDDTGEVYAKELVGFVHDFKNSREHSVAAFVKKTIGYERPVGHRVLDDLGNSQDMIESLRNYVHENAVAGDTRHDALKKDLQGLYEEIMYKGKTVGDLAERTLAAIKQASRTHIFVSSGDALETADEWRSWLSDRIEGAK